MWHCYQRQLNSNPLKHSSSPHSSASFQIVARQRVDHTRKCDGTNAARQCCVAEYGYVMVFRCAIQAFFKQCNSFFCRRSTTRQLARGRARRSLLSASRPTTEPLPAKHVRRRLLCLPREPTTLPTGHLASSSNHFARISVHFIPTAIPSLFKQLPEL